MVDEDGAASPVEVCGEKNSILTNLGDNGPPYKGKGGVLRYWDCRGGVKIMRGGSEPNTEEGGGAP